MLPSLTSASFIYHVPISSCALELAHNAETEHNELRLCLIYLGCVVSAFVCLYVLVCVCGKYRKSLPKNCCSVVCVLDELSTVAEAA